MSTNITIYDVAAASGYSLATISRVLNHPEKVKPSTREKVLKVIDELGYRPNMIARGLASRRTTTVGVIISDITRASVAEMIGGINDISDTYDYSIKIFSIHDDIDVNDVMKNVIAEQVDGVIYLNDELSDESIEDIKTTLKQSDIPFVFANVLSEERQTASVAIDYFKAGYDMTKDLINQGKKNIYLLSTARRYSVNLSKENGYEKAMKEHGLEPLIFRTSGDTSINEAHFNEFFNDKQIDAALAVRNSIAVSFMNVAINKGYRVPQDIAVASFQNTRYAVLARPKLTVIDIPVYDIGAVAMRLLTKLMEKKTKDVGNTKIILPHNIIKRESTN